MSSARNTTLCRKEGTLLTIRQTALMFVLSKHLKYSIYLRSSVWLSLPSDSWFFCVLYFSECFIVALDLSKSFIKIDTKFSFLNFSLSVLSFSFILSGSLIAVSVDGHRHMFIWCTSGFLSGKRKHGYFQCLKTQVFHTSTRRNLSTQLKTLCS